MPPPVFDESQSVIQRPYSLWPTIGRWIANIVRAVFPWPFVAYDLARLPWAKAEHPNVAGLGGHMLGVVLIQFAMMVPILNSIFDHVARLSMLTVPDERLALTLVIAAYVVALLFVARTIIALIRRSRRYPALFAWQWLVVAAVVGFEFLYWNWVLGSGFQEAKDVFGFDAGAKIVVSISLAGACLWFLLVSRQSKNTFVR